MRRIYPYLLVAWAVTLSAGAEVLVTTDGSVIETRGPWQQKGKMLVFTLANGQLSALRTEDVDFDATQRRNAPPSDGAGSVAEPPAQKPKAKIVITDADVAHLDPDLAPEPAPTPEGSTGDAQADASGVGGTGDSGAEAPATSQVRVIAWDQEDPADGEGRVIFGTLRNDGNSFATDIALEVSVYEAEGALGGTQTVTPVRTSLRPGESTTFRAQFRNVFEVGATRMIVSSLELEVGNGVESPEPALDQI